MPSSDKKSKDLRMPPNDVEAEISALGSLMLDKDAIFRVADALLPYDFYQPKHKEIFEAMLDLFTRREPIDILSVTSRLREKGKLDEIGGSAYLTTLVNSVPTASHVEHYCSIVRKKRLLRDLIDASSYIAQLGYREADNVEELIDEAEQRIFGVAKDSLRQEFLRVREALEEAWERIERIHRNRDTLRGVPTGFEDLDNLLGGLQKSDLVVLAARPSLGKTSLALDIARNAALLGHPVGVFSLEMSRDQLIDRLIASQGGIDLWRLRTGHLRADGADNDFTRIQRAMATLSEAPLFIDDSASPTVVELRAKARRLQTEHKLALVIIDYLQLIRGHHNIESRVQEVSEISRALKAMAKELNIPVLAISQLSRGVEMRPSSIPKLSDLRESGCLAGDTLITRADTGERIRIKDLVGKTDIPVFSINQNFQLEIKTISKVFSSGIKQISEIKTRSGRTIKASTNHPFLALEGWKRLDKLQIDEKIGITQEIYSPILLSFFEQSKVELRSSCNPASPFPTIRGGREELFFWTKYTNMYWDEIVSITPLGKEEVFDATVPDTHNFVANDIIVHNSIEQDSDVVMFIYREDKAKENSDRKNIAEIRIEKHRNGPTGKLELFFQEESATFRSIAKHFEEPL